MPPRRRRQDDDDDDDDEEELQALPSDDDEEEEEYVLHRHCDCSYTRAHPFGLSRITWIDALVAIPDAGS